MSVLIGLRFLIAITAKFLELIQKQERGFQVILFMIRPNPTQQNQKYGRLDSEILLEFTLSQEVVATIPQMVILVYYMSVTSAFIRGKKSTWSTNQG